VVTPKVLYGAMNVVEADEEATLFLAHDFLEMDVEGSSGKAQEVHHQPCT
jgi:hypothetical protein